jgi:hypothetical protein
MQSTCRNKNKLEANIKKNKTTTTTTTKQTIYVDFTYVEYVTAALTVPLTLSPPAVKTQ